MLVRVFCVAFLVAAAAAAGCHSTTPSYGVPNLLPIQQGEGASTLVMSFVNGTIAGKLYLVSVPQQDENASSSIQVIHLWGASAYEMGFAQGYMLKNELNTFITGVWNYLETQVDEYLGSLPPWLATWIADMGLDAALDATYEASVDYSGAYFYEEMHGLSDASGVDYLTIRNVHMIAGLTQGKCSMMGAWGSALAANGGSSLLQFRALDWNMDGPFRQYATLTVYHPPSGASWNNFALVGFPGFIGGLTGMSDKQLAISEIGVDYPDATFGTESYFGVPFIYMLRDILQFDATVDDAINRMINTKRTCDLILGVGDGKLGEFRGFAYSSSLLTVMDDENMLPENSTWHPRMTDVVCWGMDWLCPAYNLVLSQEIQANYGHLTLDTISKNITAIEMSGSNHVAAYDLTNMVMDVSYAAPLTAGGDENAYARQFTRFDMKKLFGEAYPTDTDPGFFRLLN